MILSEPEYESLEEKMAVKNETWDWSCSQMVG